MIRLESQYIHYNNTLEAINRRAGEDPQAFARDSEQAYQSQLRQVAARAAGRTGDCGVVLLAGPSASGKTTTAHLLSEALRQEGVSSQVISLDDFYLSEADSPRLEDGRPDFESVYALDVPQIKECLLSLMETRSCCMPVFDFASHRPKAEKRRVELPPHSLVILEGLHALNPILSQGLPRGKLLHAYLSVKQGVEGEGGRPLLGPNDMRLVRRLVRDARFRACTAERTLDMWPSVMRGEYQYIKPFRPSADLTINTFLAYEGCVLRDEALALLAQVPSSSPHWGEACRLREAVAGFTPLPSSCVPEKSILHEFLG